MLNGFLVTFAQASITMAVAYFLHVKQRDIIELSEENINLEISVDKQLCIEG